MKDIANNIAVMFDTNIFDEFINRTELIENISKNITIYATDIQYMEINKIPDTKIEYKKRLKKVFHKIIDEKADPIHTQWFAFGLSNFGHNRFINGREIDVLSKHKNHIEDALIYLTAESRLMIMVTNDKKGVFSINNRKNSSILVLSFNEFSKIYLKSCGCNIRS